jgi:hypothetical protein
LGAKVRQVQDSETQARMQFLNGQYDPLRTCLGSVRGLALGAAGDLETAHDRCASLAKEAASFVGVNVGLFKVGKQGNKEKAEKLKRLAERFDLLARQTRTLGQ